MHPIVFLISVIIGLGAAWLVAGRPELPRRQVAVAHRARRGYRGEAE